MRSTILLTLIFIVNLSYGQTEKSTSKTVAENFVKNYNADDYEAIFSMFAGVMQDALPLERTTEFLTGLKAQAGNISKHEFIKYENGTYASYKTTFERAIYALNISIDDNSKINGLLVKAFVEEVSSENVVNNLSVIDNTITKEQSEIIFENTKSFPNQTQISFAIIRNGNVSYYGLERNIDTLSTIDNHQSIFEIGSITKVFTSTLLSGFVIDNKIDLNDNIDKHLDFTLYNDSKITFKELSNHTSGLPRLPPNLDLTTVDMTNPYKAYSEDDLEDYLTTSLELAQDSKGKYQYSNLGAGLIGYILSEMEGISYGKLLDQRIFSKFGMSSSTTNHMEIEGEFVKGLDAEGKEVSNWDFLALAGAGGILSNVEDLSRFALAQFDSSNEELKLTRQKTFELNDNMNIGLAWHLIKSETGSQWTWHNGGTGGYSSSMAIDIEKNNGVIMLSNVSAFNPSMGNIDKLCFELMKSLEIE